MTSELDDNGRRTEWGVTPDSTANGSTTLQDITVPDFSLPPYSTNASGPFLEEKWLPAFPSYTEDDGALKGIGAQFDDFHFALPDVSAFLDEEL